MRKNRPAESQSAGAGDLYWMNEPDVALAHLHRLDAVAGRAHHIAGSREILEIVGRDQTRPSESHQMTALFAGYS
jgi:hypothetical protein